LILLGDGISGQEIPGSPIKRVTIRRGVPQKKKKKRFSIPIGEISAFSYGGPRRGAKLSKFSQSGQRREWGVGKRCRRERTLERSWGGPQGDARFRVWRALEEGNNWIWAAEKKTYIFLLIHFGMGGFMGGNSIKKSRWRGGPESALQS